jgi:hypothetical protein
MIQHKINVSQYSIRSLKVKDLTGAYNAIGNITGWGLGITDPNPDPSDVGLYNDIPGIVFILKIAGVQYTYSDTVAIENMGFPNASNQEIVLTAQMFGLTKFPDGYAEFTSQVNGQFTYNDGVANVTEGFYSITTQELFFYKESECCLFNAAVPLDPNNKKICGDEEWKRFSDLNILFNAMLIQAEGGKYDLAAQTLVNMTEVCASSKSLCNGCN